MRAVYVVSLLVQKYSDALSLLQCQTLIRGSYGKTSEPLTLVKQCVLQTAALCDNWLTFATSTSFLSSLALLFDDAARPFNVLEGVLGDFHAP